MGIGKVGVAMSGGVDSSVAAALLGEAGYEVIGISMMVWDGEFGGGNEVYHSCYGPDEAKDVEDARSVARYLGIPFHIFDLKEEYRDEVLKYCRSEYLAGRTPNPCVRCNRRIKFGALFTELVARGIEVDYFATGHYARLEYDAGKNRYLLKKARDIRKDQSYFLFGLSQSRLSRCLFPIGSHTKAEVREVASGLGFCVADKPESQDFIAGGYRSLVEGTGEPGPIVDKEGRKLGEHKGIPYYTIGQRRGLGVVCGEPLYVIAIEPERNTIVVGSRCELYSDGLIVDQVNWVAVDGIDGLTEAKVKVRYRHDDAEAMITPLENDQVYVEFREPQLAITPGQAAVFYDGDVVLGGGTIVSPNEYVDRTEDLSHD